MPHVGTREASRLCAQPRGCLCAAASLQRPATFDNPYKQTHRTVKQLCRAGKTTTYGSQAALQDVTKDNSRQSSRLTMRSPRVSMARVVSAASSPTSDT